LAPETAAGGEMHAAGSAAMVSALAKARLVNGYRFLVHPHIMGSGKTPDKGVIVLSYRPVKIK
jgi:hypothetical protein